jgi:uncharacterized protein YhbP (UPF0306 family)
MTDLRSRLSEFLGRHDTMTLATVGPDGEPQAAAVFYAVDDELNFYFLSDPNARHSRNLQRESRTAATIQADRQNWQEIRGLQIEGAVRPVDGAGEKARAVRAFAERFGFLRGLLGDDPVDAPRTLRGPLASSRFYILRPAWIRLIDNTQGFGHKDELRPESTTDNS